MYGHMLLGLASFIQQTQDEDTWDRVCKKCGMKSGTFFTYETYNDDLFFTLAHTASKLLDIPMIEFLEKFGEHTFAVYWRKSTHDTLLEVLGDSMSELVGNLDALHYQLSGTYNKMIAPSFSCEAVGFALKVRYHSCREGLIHYVKGILMAVARHMYRLDTEIEVLGYKQRRGVMLDNHYELMICLKGGCDEGAVARLLGKNRVTEVNGRTRCRSGSIKSHDRRRLTQRRNTATTLPPAFHIAALPRHLVSQTEETSVDRDTQWPVTPSLFSKICPFHILFDNNLFVMSMGRNMAKLISRKFSEHTLGVYFTIELPVVQMSYRNIRSQSGGLFILSLKDSILVHSEKRKNTPRFRGQMIPVSNISTSPIVFLATPAANSIEELEAMGMSMDDISEEIALCELLQANRYLSAQSNLSDELEKAKHVLDLEKQHLQREKGRTDELLHMMLPSQIACELQESGGTTPREFPQVSILFTGLTNFQQICKKRSPLGVVTLLNALFKSFDGLVEKHHVYKVETTGDSYMMVAGLPDTATEHAQAVTNMAFNMREVVEELNETDEKDILELVIGIHSGPVVAGVIGSKLPRYCLFGDTVNTASRMNSTGKVGKIHISEATHKHLETANNSSYHFINRGKIYVKGLGRRTTYFVEPSNTLTNSPVQVHPLPAVVEVPSFQECVPPETLSVTPAKTSWTAPVSTSHGVPLEDTMPNSSTTMFAKMKAGHLKCPFAIYHNDSIESDVDAIPVM